MATASSVAKVTMTPMNTLSVDESHSTSDRCVGPTPFGAKITTTNHILTAQ